MSERTSDWAADVRSDIGAVCPDIEGCPPPSVRGRVAACPAGAARWGADCSVACASRSLSAACRASAMPWAA
nr:MAG TPA: hypothetical protein [Caudoviricetes sp.]